MWSGLHEVMKGHTAEVGVPIRTDNREALILHHERTQQDVTICAIEEGSIQDPTLGAADPQLPASRL